MAAQSDLVDIVHTLRPHGFTPSQMIRRSRPG
jgi:hypothetical protein